VGQRILVEQGRTLQPLEVTVLGVTGEFQSGRIDSGRNAHVRGRSTVHQPPKQVGGDVGVPRAAEMGEGVRVSERGLLDDGNSTVIVHTPVRQVMKRRVGGVQERGEGVAAGLEEVCGSGFVERNESLTPPDGSAQQASKCAYSMGRPRRPTHHQRSMPGTSRHHHQGAVRPMPLDRLRSRRDRAGEGRGGQVGQGREAVASLETAVRSRSAR
jgi:hypothetical protein